MSTDTYHLRNLRRRYRRERDPQRRRFLRATCGRLIGALRDAPGSQAVMAHFRRGWRVWRVWRVPADTSVRGST